MSKGHRSHRNAVVKLEQFEQQTNIVVFCYIYLGMEIFDVLNNIKLFPKSEGGGTSCSMS